MSSSRKKVDTWYYTVSDVVMRDYQKRMEREDDEPEVERIPSMIEKKVEVDVFMLKETDEDKTPPFALKSVEFEVKCAVPKLCIRGADIELLKRAVWNQLDEHYEIEWFDYYLVKVTPARIYEGQGEGLEFSYDSVWKGITWDGKEMLREYARLDRYGDPYRIKPWPGKFTTRDGQVVACIPRDARTEEALEEFGKKIALIREKLADFLTPENIMFTLANVSGVGLLPQPAPEPAPEEKEVKGTTI